MLCQLQAGPWNTVHSTTPKILEYLPLILALSFYATMLKVENLLQSMFQDC